MIWVDTTEEFILNYKALPEEMDGWRYYRIEYHNSEKIFTFFEHGIYVPPKFDRNALEKLFEEALKTENNIKTINGVDMPTEASNPGLCDCKSLVELFTAKESEYEAKAEACRKPPRNLTTQALNAGFAAGMRFAIGAITAQSRG